MSLSRGFTARYWCLLWLAAWLPGEAAEVSLDSGWQILFQDHPSYSEVEVEVDDAAWQPIAIGQTWESALGVERDGFAWYRL